MTTRRDFLMAGGTALAAGSVVSSLSKGAYAAEDNKLKVGLVGCGGRGGGAAQDALRADDNTVLYAMADTFADRITAKHKSLMKSDVKGRIDVPRERQFTGFDGFKKVISSCDVVLLATPPHFRPMHVKAAVDAGKHLFVEKPVAVDGPGVRSVIESCKKAKKQGTAVVSGLCYRYHTPKVELYKRIHGGAIGDIVAMRCSYFTGGLWHHGRKKEWSEMEYQVRNWLYFNWLSGDHITEQHIHSLDKLAWAIGRYPIAATATGGRIQRTQKQWGNIYDHFATEYDFGNGVTGFSRCRQQNGTSRDVTDTIYGTKGHAQVMRHTLHQPNGKAVWRYRGEPVSMYQQEHDELFRSIRKGTPINNGDYMASSTLMALMGRDAAYTGKTVKATDLLNSKVRLGPTTYEWGEVKLPPVAIPGTNV